MSNLEMGLGIPEENPDKRESEILESYDEAIVAHNLTMLNEQMMYVLFGESMGGNAGSYKIDGETCSCVAVNGFVNKNTGEIIAFGSFQDIEQDIVKNNLEITLRIALAPTKYVIVDFLGKKVLKNQPLNNIEKAIEQYNANWESRSKK